MTLKGAPKLALVVLISGNGSNLQSIIDAINSGILDAKIALVISNCADAYGLGRAHNAGIPTQVVSHVEYKHREDYDQVLGQIIESTNPDLIILAGFMRILSAGFVARFAGKILNIHPSLLPKFKGTNTHQRVLDEGDKKHGATVHLVIEALDEGPIILQSQILVNSDDTADTLGARVLEIEHVIYPQAIQRFADGTVTVDKNGVINQ